MALAIKPRPVARPAPVALEVSSLKVFDIDIDKLIASEENPNEQNEATFDQLVEGIRAEGIDEPVHVIPRGDGTYIITSGHHRVKGAGVVGLKKVPCIIKEGWDEDKRKIELIRRNMLKGNLNPEKFTQLYNDLHKRGFDESVLKLQLGFTTTDAFNKVYKGIEKSLNPAQRKKLAEAKEKITSIDGLSSVINGIFKDHGSDLDHGFVVFAFGTKEHTYIECDKELSKIVSKFKDDIISRGALASEVFKDMISKYNLGNVKPSPKVEERRKARETKA